VYADFGENFAGNDFSGEDSFFTDAFLKKHQKTRANDLK